MITEHTICALPEDNINWRHFAIKVQRRGNGWWVLCNGGFYFTDDSGWVPHIGDALQLAESAALALAEDLAPTIEVNGLTVADVLERSRR